MFTYLVAGALTVLVGGKCAFAQDQPAAGEEATAAAPAPAPLTLESVSAKADAAALAGHNAWMLTCSALVLFMTAPGLAMFYGGLVRKKNVLGVMMQCMFLMGLMTVIWALYGYSLAFGDADGAIKPYIGNGEYLFMNGVQRSWNEADQRSRRTDVGGGAVPIPAADAHAVPGHVLHHHAGADLRRVRRADEVQHDGACSSILWGRSSTARCATGCGTAASWHSSLGMPGVTPIAGRRRSTSPAARSCTSARAFRR